MGFGSFGNVYKASRKGEPFALKILKDQGEPQTVSALRHQLEGEILRQINHPRVPEFIESFTLENNCFLVQKFLPGSPLSSLLQKGYRFRESEVREIIKQLLEILDALHCPAENRNAVVHRDLRLSNLILHEGNVFLIDFGFARFLDSSRFPQVPDPQRLESGDCGQEGWDKDAVKRQVKHPGFLTYRLLRRELSPRSDLFGTGVVAVDLLTNWVEDESWFEQPWDQVLSLSPEFVGFLKRLLSGREDAFQSAAEAITALKQLC